MMLFGVSTTWLTGLLRSSRDFSVTRRLIRRASIMDITENADNTEDTESTTVITESTRREIFPPTTSQLPSTGEKRAL